MVRSFGGIQGSSVCAFGNSLGFVDSPNIGIIPIGSMYGIFTYIYHRNQPNVGKYTIHGSYGIEKP